MLSVIIPACNEEDMILKTKETVSGILYDAGIVFELIFVDDGSKDHTWEIISQMNDCQVKGISFSRNFGKEAAVFAGLQEAEGDCAVVIDCDLQHPPEKIVEMYELWEHGYEVVEGVKTERGKESIFHALASKVFYCLISRAAGFDMSGASDFKLLDRKAVNALLELKEKGTFFRALSAWVGFRTVSVGYEVQKRMAGQSKWTASSLVKYALSNIASFTAVPMHIITFLGMMMFVISVIVSAITLYQKLSGIALGGFTTVILLQCLIGSMLLVSIGITGFYISKIYEEVKGRPKYIIAHRTKRMSENRKRGGRELCWMSV